MSKKAVDEQDSRRAAAQAAIDQIKEKFGEGSIMRLGEERRMQVETVPTGCLSLDLALGVFGVDRSRQDPPQRVHAEHSRRAPARAQRHHVAPA